MSIGMDSVNLEQAVRSAEVSRSSAYAIWSSDHFSPQEEFQRAVLTRAVADRKETLESLNDVIAKAYGELVGTGSLQQVMRELIRIAAKHNIEATADSMSWKLVIALRAVLHSAKEDERDQELVDWITSSTDELQAFTIETVLRPLAATLGIQPRPQYGDRAYALGEMSTAAVSEGLSMRYWLTSTPFLDGLYHPTEKASEPNWSMYALIYEQIVHMFLEPVDGDWDD